MPGGAVHIRVTGAMQMRRLGLELRAMGVEGQGFRKELLAAIRAAAAPAPAAAKASAREVLPHGGGSSSRSLSQIVASDRIGVRNRLTGKGVGVRIANPKGGIRLDKGEVRHPVFGNRKNWVLQKIRPNWFTDPMEATSPEVTAAVLGVIIRASRQLGRTR